MLTKYLLYLDAPKNYLKDNYPGVFSPDLHILWNSLSRSHLMKKKHLSELEDVYFKGMRENWFPLILLNLYDLLLYDNKEEEANNVLEYFKSLCCNPNFYSFYIDDACIFNNNIDKAIGIYLRCDGHYRDYPIHEIFHCFNIRGFRIMELKS